MTMPAAQAHPQFWMNRNTVAIGAGVLAAILTAIGQFKGSTFSDEWPAWLIELAAIAIATIVVFWLVVPRTLRGANARMIARTALILGVVGVLSLVVFWLGLPTVLAAGAAYLAANVDRTAMGANRGIAMGTLALAGVTVVLAIVIAFVG
jgi:hypothetical protein